MTYEPATDRHLAGAAMARRPVLSGAIAGHALFRLKPCDVQAMRRFPGPIPEGWNPVPSSVLRYSDEQTVAGVAAVFRAIAEAGFAPGDCAGWGVVAASRFLGRANLARALRSFAAEGVWGTSPHLIPHFALHSLSGSISLALGLHGPNLGVGGGLYATAEGVLTALTWLADGIVPGVWLVLSGWTPEFVPDAPPVEAGAGGDSECRALALAVVPAAADVSGYRDFPRIELVPAAAPIRALPAPDLAGLAHWLGLRGRGEPRTIATDASGTFLIDLVPPGAGRLEWPDDEQGRDREDQG